MNYPFIESDRFKVAPSCPCGKSNKDGKFRPFLILGKPASTNGMCFSCGGVFYPDRENQMTIKDDSFLAPAPKEPLKVIQETLVQATMRCYHKNNMALMLQEKHPEKAARLLAYFSIGTTRDGGTIYWYRDIVGNYRKPKVMYYKPDGHRMKDSVFERQNKPSPLQFTNKEGYEYCLFGEFQLALYPATAKIVIVESEKSALIGYAHHPEYIWLATGGAVSFKQDQAKVLANRKAIILPDMDEPGRKGAIKTRAILSAIGCESVIQDLDQNRNDGADVADLLLL
jgi:hypothetical protein